MAAGNINKKLGIKTRQNFTEKNSINTDKENKFTIIPITTTKKEDVSPLHN